jgi:hypothetical protein
MKTRLAPVLALQMLCLLLVLAVAAPLAASGDATKGDPAKVVGSWGLELMYEGQLQHITLEIKTKDDGSLTGRWIGPHRTNELVDWTWDGKTLTFTRNVEREGKPVALKHKATVEGDTMKGEITQPPPAEKVPFTATRKKAE